MKKIFPVLLLVLLAACKQEEKPFDPGIAFSRTGEVTLVASIENAATRASLTGRGEARWLPGDKIAVVCTDGTLAELPLDGTGGTRKAVFKGKLPDGKTLGDFAVFPASAVESLSGTTLTFSLPAERRVSGTGECALMVAPIGDSYEIQFGQVFSYGLFELSNVNASTRRIEVTADRNLSGTFSVDLQKALKEGVAAVEGTAPVSYTFEDAPETSMNLVIPIPVGTYNAVAVTAYDVNNKKLNGLDVVGSLSTFGRGDLRAMAAELPDAAGKQPKEGAILVAEIYWATGNLEHVVGQTGEGFMDDWRLAPQQWHYSGCEQAGATQKAVTWAVTNYDNYSLFNYGGLGMDSMDNVAEHTVMAPVGADISGKMFIDRMCTIETTDFAEAKYGDIAFWASKGKYRLPTGAEFKALYETVSRQFSAYKVSDSNIIRGILYFDPVGEAPVASDVEADLTEDALATGLFLPYCGRRYTAQPLTVNQLSNQGPYRSGESITGDGAYDDTCYGGIFHQLSAAPRAYPYFNKDFGAVGGYAVRPVLVDQN